MKIQVRAVTKREVKYLRARCGVRYWEDATVNGECDADGSRIPCRSNDDWCPTIDLEMGEIEGWPDGTTADIHYKVCDDGNYELLDADRRVVKAIDGYVPDIMCPGDIPDGDYVIMSVGPDGAIKNWRADLSDFERERS